MSLPEHRVHQLFREEIERANLLNYCPTNVNNDNPDLDIQLPPKANPLYADFRFDHVYQAWKYFTEKKISFSQLFNLQRYLPVVYPWNLEYDSLRQNVNRRHNIFPMMIVMAENDQDLHQALDFSKKYQIPIRLRGGAHNFESQSIGDGMVIDQSRRKKMYIKWEDDDQTLNKDLHTNTLDESNRVNQKIPYIYMEPGCLLGPVADFLDQQGLVMIMGSCPNNGVVGFLLGGGIGYLSRRYGLGSDSLAAVKAILADGTEIIADEHQNKDFLWASRGAGGGNFGIITGLKVRVYPIKHVTQFKITFAFSAIKKLLREWQEWFPTTSNRMMSQVSFFNGSSDLNLQGIFTGSPQNAEKEINRLINHGLEEYVKERIIEGVEYIDSAYFFGGKGHWLLHFKAKSSMLDEKLSEKALDIIEKYMKQGNGEDIFEITSLGGRMGEISNAKSAYAHRDKFAWMMINAHWSSQDDTDVRMKWVRDFHRELRTVGEISKSVYANTPDADLQDYLNSYYGSNLNKLIEIKKKYDPENLFNYNQSIPIKNNSF